MSTSKKRPGTNEHILKKIVCYKEGQTDKNYQKKLKHAIQRSGERNRGIGHVGCKAKLIVVRNKSSPSGIVSSFLETHNHASTTPSRVHLLRSHRHISNVKKALRRKKIQFFYFDFDKDSDDKFVRCFWADSFSRRVYNFFGDVVVFNTTYNTNRYGMIFAPFTRVNHHGQTIIFGCGFLSDETIDSCVWLLGQWMNAMPRGALQMIITDQDSALTRAIAQVIPNTFHRYCIWHILNKFSEKLNTVIYRDNYHLMKNIIMNSEDSEEFETSWMNMLQSTKLGDNDWLQQTYEMRSRWVPAFVKHISAAGMSSSRRAESSHSFLKRDEILMANGSSNVKDLYKKGIPCRHLLAYFRIKQILKLPTQYILQRWTKHTKVGQVWEKDHEELNDIPNQSLMSRHSNLSQLLSVVIDNASLIEEGTNLLRNGFKDVHNKIKEINIDNGVERVFMGQKIIEKQILINEPLQVRAKGCGKRLKKSKEKKVNKERVCHGCGLRGQSHDKRNCPTLLER
ncbi:protein FAR1-RELATED SEQUENCE 5-like [Olea europaea var. sylvestris]|uniref:protein FAR1-RELATED SEQUENCE 5-like n=1 Tax=Olea europaea var. sylvestris TaxID=158386 RepID=UPI000C1CF2D4|nr:protein FAR1-RELATED SEQUENCE 5-like [Olea europaea var. sylvestris]